jgi:hypothetical protein
MKRYKAKLLIFALLILLVVLLYFLDLKDHITLERWNAYKAQLLDMVKHHYNYYPW